MDFKDFSQQFAQRTIEVKKLIHEDLPKKIGNLAVSLFKRNFREGGFFGEKWVPAKRLGGRGGAGSRRVTLTGTGDLGRSIQYEPGDGEVTVLSDLPYSAIHNEGGDTHPTVTPKMRKFAWAMFYKNGGGRKAAELTEDAQKWRAMAITKKHTLRVHIPRRQFLGEHEKLMTAVNIKIDDEMFNALNK